MNGDEGDFGLFVQTCPVILLVTVKGDELSFLGTDTRPKIGKILNDDFVGLGTESAFVLLKHGIEFIGSLIGVDSRNHK